MEEAAEAEPKNRCQVAELRSRQPRLPPQHHRRRLHLPLLRLPCHQPLLAQLPPRFLAVSR